MTATGAVSHFRQGGQDAKAVPAPSASPLAPEPRFRVVYESGNAAEFVSLDAALMFAVRLHRHSSLELWNGKRWTVFPGNTV